MGSEGCEMLCYILVFASDGSSELTIPRRILAYSQSDCNRVMARVKVHLKMPSSVELTIALCFESAPETCSSTDSLRSVVRLVGCMFVGHVCTGSLTQGGKFSLSRLSSAERSYHSAGSIN